MDQSHEELPGLLALDVDGYFEQLMQVYQHRLYAFALRQVGNQHDADDIVQEAFLRAHHALKSYPKPRIQALQLRQWLYKITLNVLRNAVRKAEHASTTLDVSEESPVLAIEDSAASPEEEIDWRESKQELAMLLTTLPEPYRIAINLHYFEDLSYREIATLLNQPAGSVKSNVSRGLLLLRKALDASTREAR